MAIEEISLGHGLFRHLDAGSIGVSYVNEGHDGDPPEAIVTVRDDSEHRFSLHPGEEFPIGDQTWKLDHIKDVSNIDWTAVFVRIE